jgi:choline dehydrogenase-like flavoprotein
MSDASLLFDIQSVPQTNLQNRSIAVMAGKVVGGSSAVNAMMTIRPAAEDFDRWGSMFSEESHWSWDGMLPYFKRALNFVPPDEAVTESANITTVIDLPGVGQNFQDHAMIQATFMCKSTRR